jgi:hypothetical protein
MEVQNLLPAKIQDELPSMVKNEIIKLPPNKQSEFLEEYQRKRKSIGLSYLLWIFALHYAYFGQISLMLLQRITCGGLTKWWIIDLFRIPQLVIDFNKDLAIDIFRNLKAIS